MPKEAPAFLKATDPVCGLVQGEGVKETWMSKETRYWNFKWWLMDKEDDPVRESMTRSLNKARKNYLEDLAQDVQGDIDGMEGGVNGVEISSFNPFGRGYACGRGQLIPSRWLLIGGSRSIVGCGKTTRRIDGPTSKAQGSGAGKLTEFFCLRCFSSNFS